MESSLVSIIIPCYNAEPWISQAIQSALEQTYENIEIIVIDDGSTDRSLEIIQSFDDKIVWRTEKNRGGCYARNKGILLAKGKFLQFLDADDILAPNKIKYQIEKIGDEENCVATCPYEIIGDRKGFKQQNSDFYQPLVNSECPTDWLVEKLMTGSCWATLPHCFLIHRKLVDVAGLWDESLAVNQDGDFFSRILLSAESVVFVPESVVYYRRQNSCSVSHGRDLAHAQSALNVCRFYSDRLLKVRDDSISRKALRQEYLRFIHTYYPYHKELVRQAVKEIHALGFSRLGSAGGKRFKFLCESIGFMNAVRARIFVYFLLSPFNNVLRIN